MLQKLKIWLLCKIYRLQNWLAWRGVDFGDVMCEDTRVAGASGELPARLYRHTDRPGRALIVYFHGGGWVIGDLRSHDYFCRRLVQHTDAVVLAVDYRLAPRHPYPAAALDCIAATAWAHANRAALRAAECPLIVAGDSAGGNLSAVVARHFAEQGSTALAGQCLMYPVTRFPNPPTASYLKNATGHGLTMALMQWFWACYTPRAGATLNHAEAPLAVVHDAPIPPQLAAAIVFTAGLDPLRDEGWDYAEALGAAGIATRHHDFPGEIHGFVCSSGLSAAHRQAMDAIQQWLQQLGASSSRPAAEQQRGAHTR